MNEKFSELYHRAWTLAEFDDEYKEKPTYERRCVVQSKIFAELIVKECVEVCAGVAAVRAGYNDVDGRDTAYSCGDMIREYFGVRE